MKWNIRINFDIYRGRHKVFSLQRVLPFLKRLCRKNELLGRKCFRKTRFINEQEAKNCMWFKKNTKRFDVYPCEVCEGWHITTHAKTD